MTDTITNPYAEGFNLYWQAGWRGILPLPYAKKKDPPTGYTGHTGAYPSFADCHTWADSQPSNIALRMTDDVVGIDVDDYGDRAGGTTLSALVDKYGPLPPTWLSTSRDDGISGIRFYRIPAGAVLPSKLPGIEFIQRHHRYAVVWPSLHPDTGNTYTWIDESDPTNPGLPNLHLLPELPPAWLDGLTVEANPHNKSDIDVDSVAALLAGLPAGEPCAHIRAGAGRALEGGDRHDSYNEAVLAVIGAGRRGCPGAATVLARLRATFIAEVTAPGTTSQRTKTEAHAEWKRSLYGAAAIVADEPQGHTCPDDAYAWLAESGALPTPPTATDDSTTEDDGERAYQLQVARKAAELKIAADARTMIAAAQAAEAPPLNGVDLAAFLQQPDDPIRYRVADMWPSNGRTLLVAAAKAGKTTMVSRNLIPCLTGGGQFLGKFDVQPVTGKVVYLNLEVSENTIRAWMRHSGIPNPDRVVVVNLRGRGSALNLASPHGRRRFSDFLADQGAEVVICDPLAPVLAAHGLSEDSNSEVAQFFSWWSEAMSDAGVTDDLICHHAGHAGMRSRGASRLLDEPDAIWTVTRSTAGMGQEDADDILAADDRRYLTAYGRDVELPESGLDFDPATGKLTLLEGNGKALRRDAKDAAYERAVLDIIRSKGGSQVSKRVIVKERGNEREMGRALDRLVASGTVSAITLGSGNPTLHAITEELSTGVASVAGDTSATLATPVAGDTSATLATGGVARPYKGDTGDSRRQSSIGDTSGDSPPQTTPSQLLNTCATHGVNYVTTCPECDPRT